ncbi:MAG: tetratricopeptide repeat protein [Candidatus Melainabacteria bacterium]|nr:tetratricopeptide repeat protein [Candidatus Melainabacteria bacterium]
MQFKLSRVILITVSVVIACSEYSLPRCSAQDAPTPEKNSEPVPKKSIEALVDDDNTVANHFGASADYSLLNGQVEQAISASRKALNRDPDNIEAHKRYAEALEQKIQLRKTTDAELMRDCISEWLIVFRSEVGEEKGLGFHGISVFGHLYEDDGYAIMARQRLVAIAGRAPHPWETNTRYLKSVLRHASVTGKIISHK